MSFPSKPSKRPYDRNASKHNGKGKWQKSSNFNSQAQPLKISPGSTVFRILCPISKSGGVIGKGGKIISNIRQETGAKVKVEEPLSGDDERVIVIVGPEKEVEANTEKSDEDGKDENVPEENEAAEEDEERNEDKVSSPLVESQSEKELPSVQKALYRIFERMVEVEPEFDEEDEESMRSFCFVVRLLVLSSQVGCVLGKAGKVIKQMAAESGAQIRILPRDKLPQCASAFDELVQLTGALEPVRKALQLVSQQLLKYPPRDPHSFPTDKPIGSSSHPSALFPNSETHQPPNYQFPSQAALYPPPHERADFHLNGPQPLAKYRDTVIPSRVRPLEIIFRLLCHNEKVGGVIGKGGTIIKTIHHETRCDIKVLEAVPFCEDRIIVISGPVHPDDRISAVQDAVLRVQERIVRDVPELVEKTVLSRILVSSNELGCLLGVGGSILAEMRKLSGAYIRLVPKDQMPKCVSGNDEVVQITGEFESVQDALLQITSRLRHHLFRETLPSINPPTLPAFHDQVPPSFPALRDQPPPSFPALRDQPPPFPYMGRRELSPPGMYSSMAGLPSHVRSHLHDDRSTFSQNIHRQGAPHSSGRFPFPAPWEPQRRTNLSGPVGISEYAGVPQRKIGGFGGGNQAAVITSTTVEVVVPRGIVPSIQGEDGSCLKQIRQISGANITITEPKPGATETAIIIYGTPEQAHAAQSLLQAFVLSGSDSP